MADRGCIPYRCVLIAVITLVIFDTSGTATDFVESPMYQSVSVGEEAKFRCQHATADTIRWRINGSLVSRSNRPDGVGFDEDDPVEILTITGRLDYNGTVVECVAQFDNGSPEQVSDPALLTVTDRATEETPTSVPSQEFITSPLSVNVTVGTETMFHCEHSSADGIGWLINGTTLRSQPDLHNTSITSTNGSVRTLTVTALPQYNSTRIRCVALFHDQRNKRTLSALLLIQGPLAAVTSLTKVGFTISWEPPFSLDLTNVDPDIVYCVDVYNITCGGRDLLSSDCSVTNTNYTSLSDGHLYEYIVTPRSNMEGAENGTASQPLTGHVHDDAGTQGVCNNSSFSPPTDVVETTSTSSGPARSSNLTIIIVLLVVIVMLLVIAVIVVLLVIIFVKAHCCKHQSRPIHGDLQQMSNLVPAPPTENPRDPLVVPSVDRSVETCDNAPSLTPSSSSSDPSQPPAMSMSNGNYSQVDVKPQSVSAPPVDDKPVVYAEVMKKQGANLYAMVNPKKSTRDSYPDDLTKVDYSEIRPHEQPQQAASAENMSTAPSPTPFTTENIVAALLPVASKWRAIGEAFPLSEKRLEDNETTERDEQCLWEMTEAYMLNGDLGHTWDEIVDVLKKIEEDTLAEQIFDVHVAPYVLTLPNQPQLPEGGVYTQSLSSTLPTDDGSLDMSSPVPSGQQTEPATSVASEGEVKPDKEEPLPMPDETVCTPEIHGDAVLEMPSYEDTCSSSSESKVEAPDDVLEECDSNESSKRQVVTDGDSGVSEGEEDSLMLEKEGTSSQTTDADSSSIKSEVKASSDIEEGTPTGTHQVTTKPAQVVREHSQDDYDNHVDLPSSSAESRRDSKSIFNDTGYHTADGSPKSTASHVDDHPPSNVTPTTPTRSSRDHQRKRLITEKEDSAIPPCQHTQGATPLDHKPTEFVTVMPKVAWDDEKIEYIPFGGAAIHSGLPHAHMLDHDGQKNLLVERASSATLVTEQPKSSAHPQLANGSSKSSDNVDKVSPPCTSGVGKKGGRSTPILPDSAYISERAEHDQSALDNTICVTASR